MKRTYDEIRSIERIYEKYITKLSQIELFIKTTIEQKDFVEEAEQKISGVSSKIDEYVGKVKALANSVVLYNAVIISVYGSFELYIDELLKAYIEYLKKKNLSFQTFPLKLQEKQKQKAAEFLGNPGRFIDYGLSVEKVITDLMETMVKDNSAEVTEKLLISHGGNLKSEQINTLFNEFGIENLSDRIKKHQSLKQFSKENELDGAIIIPKGFQLLDTIVRERNKVAHGWNVDDRISFAMLLQNYVPFFRVFCKALNDIIISQIIEDGQSRGELLPFDPIIDVWGKGKIIGINNKEFRLNVGDVLYCSTPDNWNYKFEIKNLMKEKKQRKSIRAKNKNITIECDLKIRQNYQIWGTKESD